MGVLGGETQGDKGTRDSLKSSGWHWAQASLAPDGAGGLADLRDSGRHPSFRPQTQSHLQVGGKWAEPGQVLSWKLAAPPLHALCPLNSQTHALLLPPPRRRH